MDRPYSRTAGPGWPLRLGALGGVIAPPLFAAVVVYLATRYEGYSHVSQAISELGGEGASDPLLQNVNFFVLGVLVLGFAWALFRSGIATARGATLVAGLGLGLAESIPGRSPLIDGFGLIAFASLFPIITVMAYAQASEWRAARNRSRDTQAMTDQATFQEDQP